MNQRKSNAVLVDLDGVLYKGEDVITGAPKTVDWLQSSGIPHLFLTNTTSRPRVKIAEKLQALGMPVAADLILTPVIAARHWINARNIEGAVALFMPEATKGDLGKIHELPQDREHGAAALVVGDLGQDWDFATLNRAFRLLMDEPRPALIALGLTRYWRAPDGLRLDVAPFVKALELFTLAESLGGVESLINHPAIMTHASVPAERRAELGISDQLVRLSVGIEDADDLKAALDAA